MTPEETLFLQKIGLTLDSGVAWVITLTLLHGVFILLFSMSTISIIRRGINKGPQLAMFIITLASFVIATLHLGVQMASLSMTIRTFLIDNEELPLPTKVDIYHGKVFPTNLIIIWTTVAMPIISDAVILWRTSVLSQHRKRFLIGPLALWLGTIATALAYLGLSSSFEGVQNLNAGGVQQYLFTANIALSLATNATATSLIGYRLWVHRKNVVGALGKWTMGLNTLLMLVESGVIYFVLQLVTLIMSIAPHGGTGGVPGSVEWIAAQIFSSAYFEISAMYAAIVVVLVNSRRSIVETYGISDVAVDVEGQIGGLPRGGVRSGTLGRLSFVTPRPQSVVSGSSDSGDGNLTDGEKPSQERLRGGEDAMGSSNMTVAPN